MPNPALIRFGLSTSRRIASDDSDASAGRFSTDAPVLRDVPGETIRNRDALATDRRREAALDAVAAGIEAAAPDRAVREAVTVADGTLRIGGTEVDLGAYDRVLVLGGGKPAGHMARALEDLLPASIQVEGVVVATEPHDAGRIDVLAGGHPLPDETGADGARRVLAAARDANDRTLVVGAIGGGGSALLPAPAADLTLSDLRATTRSLLDAGADVRTINAVRKHCSTVKGGRLAVAAAPARVVSLVASDVVGDDVATVASGPTAPDPTTYEDALSGADRFDAEYPAAVEAHLRAGARSDRPETPTADHSAFDRVTNRVVLNGRRAVDAAADAAAAAGYEPLVLSTRLRGSAGEVGGVLAAIAEEIAASGDPVASPAVVVVSGETTVAVTGSGAGGPNAELAVGAGLDCAVDDWTLAAVDTDGRDGGTDLAGAVVDATTIAGPADERAAREALADSDSYGYLRDRDGPIETGPTGTNVNDLVVLLVE